MNIFIDKPNLLSVIRSAKKENYNDCMRMLKDNFTIFFTFAKKDILSLGQNDKQDVMQWLTQMASGINSSNKEPIRWESIFPNRPLDISTFNTEQLSSVYCLAKDLFIPHRCNLICNLKRLIGSGKARSRAIVMLYVDYFHIVFSC